MPWPPSVGSSWKRGRGPFCAGLQGRSVVRPPLAQAGLFVCFQSLAAFQTPGPGDPTVGEPADFCLEKTS